MNAGRRRALAGIAGVIIAAAIGGDVLAVRGLVTRARTEAVLRLDPYELDFYSGALARPPKPGVRRVVLYGDSRARGWPEFKHPGYELINRGIGYQTSRQVLGRFERDLAPLRPEVVVLQLGVNDLKAISLLPEHKAKLIERCKRNIAELSSRTAQLGARVILTTIFSIGQVPWHRTFYFSRDVAPAIREVNRFIVTLASDRVHILDSAAVLDGPGGSVRDEYLEDYLHLNVAGYRALDAALETQLRSLQFQAL